MTRTFLIGSAPGAAHWCDENGVNWHAVATGRLDSVLFLGIEADRICGHAPAPGDQIVLVAGYDQMDDAAKQELALLRLRVAVYGKRPIEP
jgi:hypothetical protein